MVDCHAAKSSESPSKAERKMHAVGVVEGFYGRPWLQGQRVRLLGQMMPSFGMNAYLYAPKDDQKHRHLWRQLYDLEELRVLRELITVCRDAGVRFWYGIAPGLDFGWAPERADAERELLFGKVAQLLEAGCGSIALLFDDIDIDKSGPSTMALAAQQQAQLANSLHAFLASRSPSAPAPHLMLCPTFYCEAFCPDGLRGCPYLAALGCSLEPSVPAMWTGPDIISRVITAAHVSAVQQRLGWSASSPRALVIWDNIHANDYDCRRLYMGPYYGRETLRFSPLASPVHGTVSGIFSNANCEFHPNFVPFRTLALFAADPAAYRPVAAFQQAVTEWHATGVFSSHGPDPFSPDDVQLLCELLYLPFQHGNRARRYLHAFRTLLSLFTPQTDAIVSSSSSSSAFSDAQKLSAEFVTQAKRLVGLFGRFVTCDDRELVYSMYPYCWEFKEEAIVDQRLISHLSAGAPLATFRFHPTYRGGFVADLQALLRPNPVDSTLSCQPQGLHQAIQTGPHSRYHIRPFNRSPSEGQRLLQICLRTGDGGADASALYSDLPDVLGHRYIAPYSTLEPQGVFVVVDGSEPSAGPGTSPALGYTACVVDSRDFYRRYLAEWIPEMQRLYPLSPAALDLSKSSHRVVREFYQPDVVASDPLFDRYPSHLHIDLLPEAQRKGLGSHMMDRVFEHLSNAGSTGVHLEMSPSNTRALWFYRKLGFQVIRETEDCLTLGKDLA